MKQIISIKCVSILFIAILLLAGCSSPRGLVFADREWHISNYYGQIIDKDTTYRMTFGNVLIPDPLVIVSSADSVAKYPGMDRFIADVLHTCRLDSAEILFYAPQMQTMFVKPYGDMPPMKPSSVSSPMGDERPYTMWVNEDDIEDWTREATEMYTYTYFDRRKSRIVIVDFYDYGNSPIAQITLFQSNNKVTSKMKIPEELRRSFWWYHDLKYFTRYIEFWAHQIVSHRKLAFANYKIGQEQAKRILDDSGIIVAAESVLFAGSAMKALDLYKKWLEYEKTPDKTVLYNAACAASLSGEIDYGLKLLKALASQDSTWYLKEPLDRDLENLKESPEWEDFNRRIIQRMNDLEKTYNIPLRRRLTQIRRADQDIRARFLAAFNSQPQDTVLISRLSGEMKETDAANLIEVESVLAEFGWPGRDMVGDECIAIWMVIQHADIDSQIKALPMLRDAASKGDIIPASVAMLEDRILVNTGKEQLYGTQYFYSDDNGRQKRVIYPIEDIENVDKRRTRVGLPSLREDYSSEEIETAYPCGH